MLRLSIDYKWVNVGKSNFQGVPNFGKIVTINVRPKREINTWKKKFNRFISCIPIIVMGKGSRTRQSLRQLPSDIDNSNTAQDHLYKKHHYISKRRSDDEGWKEEKPPYYVLLTTYFSYLVLICFGHLRDFFGKRFRSKNYRHLREQNVSMNSHCIGCTRLN